ncbi:hypothetical protein EDD66_11930 [Mobilisporobacter senegalensis]|uniref:S1 motif domain-containing protein n=1 Tax=Mobilisporobacter senegalensis TaxID=1329262 RepID=A0A3N1X571_9FIRM|nr:S1-like domain-containing RNA-binding protein [Mobilisporobacter senegalensis]ROR21920.1 hypothetical protein EDD66_11930 [Mobilisporobacter senegalensis]
MIKLGEIQILKVVKTTDFGVYLNDPNGLETDKVLLPKNQVDPGTKPGDEIEVFIYRDSEDRLIATTTHPTLTLGKVAMLKVIEVGNIGAFLDWGLAKDLLLPFKEQTQRVHTGDDILVSLYIDKSNRLCATMKIYSYLNQTSPYSKDDKVIGTVYELSDEFGAFVAVDNIYSALISKKELYREVKPGDSVEARVINVREDGKLDLSIREKSYIQMDIDSQTILGKLEANGGHLNFNDKSDPEKIKQEFNLSKNAFKRATGRLLKEGKVILTEDGMNLID